MEFQILQQPGYNPFDTTIITILAPSTSSIFGYIISIEINISSDGRGISFRNIGTGTEMRGLNGTRAIRQ